MKVRISLDHHEPVKLTLHEDSNNLDLIVGDLSIVLSHPQIAELEASIALVKVWRDRCNEKQGRRR